MSGEHHCHALGCKAACPPKHLMCRRHWSMVPPEMQSEVYRTVKLRKRGSVDASWAPWWRAQAEAIGYVAFQEGPNRAAYERYMNRERAFAVKLERKATR